MSGVELRVVLVGEDTEQQAAFNRETTRQSDAADLEARHSLPPRQTSQPTAKVEPPPVEPIDQRTGKPWAPDVPAEQPVISSIEKLIEHIDELVRLEKDRAGKRESGETRRKKSPEESESGGEFSSRINKVLEHVSQFYRDSHFGRTLAGQRLLHTTRMGMRMARGARHVAGKSKIIRSMAQRGKSALGRSSTALRAIGSRAGRAGAGAQALVRGAGGVAHHTAGPAATASASVPHHIVPAAARAGAGAAGAAGAGAGAAGLGTVAAVAAPLVAVGVAAGAAAFTLHKMISAIHHAAEALEDMSVDVATVKAEHQLEMELSRLDRAGRIGPDAARVEAARDRISVSMYEVQTKMLELMLKGSPVLERILDGLNVGVHGVDVVVASIDNFRAMVNDLWGEGGKDNKAAADALTKALDDFKDAWTGKDKMPHGHGIDPFLAEVLHLTTAPHNAPPPPNPGLGGHQMQPPLPGGMPP